MGHRSSNYQGCHDHVVGYVCYYVVVGHRSSDGHSLLFHFLCCTTVAVAVVSVGICCVFLWLFDRRSSGG